MEPVSPPTDAGPTPAPAAPSDPSPSPFDRARALAQTGVSVKAIQAKLASEGLDAETASLAASAAAGASPMHVHALGDEGLEPNATLPPAGYGSDEPSPSGSFADAVINLVGGLACVGIGFALAIGWSLGHNGSVALFGLMVISIFRIRWTEVADSALRLVIAAALIATAFRFGPDTVVAGAFIAASYGLFFAARGWSAYRRFDQRKRAAAVDGARAGEGASSSAVVSASSAPEKPANAEPPVPSP